jgi:glutamate 5-kinase
VWGLTVFIFVSFFISMIPKAVVFKIGTSLLTTEEGTIRLSFLSDLCEDLVRIKKLGWNPVLVSSGAMASGRGLVKKAAQTLTERSVLSVVGQPFLMRYYAEFFAVHGVLVAQCLLTWDNFENSNERGLLKKNMESLLAHGVIPIVNENDLVALEEIRSGDNDVLSAKISVLLEAEKLLILSDVDGLYTENPHENPQAEKISEVPKIDESVYKYAGTKTSPNSLGGMQSKIKAAQIATQGGVEVLIFKGVLGGGNISEILLHEKSVGTRFLSQK